MELLFEARPEIRGTTGSDRGHAGMAHGIETPLLSSSTVVAYSLTRAAVRVSTDKTES